MPKRDEMMFRLSAFIFVAFCLGISSVAGVKADVNTDARQAILAIYQKQHQGYFRKDVTAELSGVSPNFVATNVFGTKEGYATERKHMQSAFDNPTPSEWASQRTSWVIEGFTVKGNAAKVRVRSHSVVQSISAQTKRPFYQCVDEVVMDIWAKTPHGWVEIGEQFLLSRHTVSLARII